MAEKGIDYRVEYGNFVLFGHDCGFGCRQTNNAPDDRTFQVSVVTCRRAPLHGGIPVDTRGSASRMARLSPLGARFAPCGGAGWKLGFQFYRKKFTPAMVAGRLIACQGQKSVAAKKCWGGVMVAEFGCVGGCGWFLSRQLLCSWFESKDFAGG